MKNKFTATQRAKISLLSGTCSVKSFDHERLALLQRCSRGVAVAPARAGFTLIELIVVISVIALLAALAMPVYNIVVQKSMIQSAISERKAIETAIEAYHADYGFYPPSNPGVTTSPLNLYPAKTNQLYYELEGMVVSNVSSVMYFTNLDNSGGLSAYAVQQSFGVSGIMNCTKGTGEDAKTAQNYLTGLKPGQIATFTNNTVAGVEFVHLLCSGVVADANYAPLGGILTENGRNANPWRYICPGLNNPKSYDLWLQLSVAGKEYLICNWNDQQQINATNYP